MTMDDLKFFIAFAVVAGLFAMVATLIYWCFFRETTTTTVTLPADQPTDADPMAVRGAAGHLEHGMRELVRQEVAFTLRGRTTKNFDGTPDAYLAMELIARGWVAYKPSQDLKKS